MNKNAFFLLGFFLCSALFSEDAQEKIKSNSITINMLSLMDVGDVFSFGFKHKDEDEPWQMMEDGTWIPPLPSLARSPSNYGFREISPYIHDRFEVVAVSRNIPNLKGWSWAISTNENAEHTITLMAKVELPEYERDKILILKRFRPEQSEDEDIFWYINTANGRLESFEDGHMIGIVTGITYLSVNRRLPILFDNQE